MTEYGQESLWRETATANAERARDLVARLERRAKAEDEVAARDTYLGLLGIATGERVLDVGCGSGAVTREIARRVGSRGLAVGVDPSPALLAAARELAQEAGVGDRVQFHEGNVLRLPFPAGSFDAVVRVTVLSHVPGAEATGCRVAGAHGHLLSFAAATKPGICVQRSWSSCIGSTFLPWPSSNPRGW